jgi:hypothetical protein
VTEVACRLGQPSLAEACVDAAFELRHGVPDVASGQLDLVTGRTRLHHATTVEVSTPRHCQTDRPAISDSPAGE